MAQASRPLSPHLGIYRWYFTMALSIAHRVTGAGLAVGLLLLTWWLLALAGGPGQLRHRAGGHGQFPGRPDPVRLHHLPLLPQR